MKTLSPQEQDEIESLTYITPPEDQGNPHNAGQAIWGELAMSFTRQAPPKGMPGRR